MKLLLLLFLPWSLAAQQPVAGWGNGKAQTFISSLTSAQKAKATFKFNDKSRLEWHYFPPSMHAQDGIAVKDLTITQKSHLQDLLKYFLSERGYVRTSDIMSNESLLKILQPNNEHRIPENYYIAFYGHPHQDSIWGWNFTGHHLALNFTLINNKPAFAPFFFGANPAESTDSQGIRKRIIREEEDLGFELLNSLSNQQKQQAIFSKDALSDIVTTNSPQVNPLVPVGILAKDLTPAQKVILDKLVETYLSSMPANIAKMRFKRIAVEDKDAIRFGWAGGRVAGEPHYYRVQGKTFLIEFDNTQNNANHIHTVWRDFKGDFGQDLLRAHYKASHHHLKNPKTALVK